MVCLEKIPSEEFYDEKIDNCLGPDKRYLNNDLDFEKKKFQAVFEN